ncbi:phage antirepressor KilAC domain-containing protein [Sphingobacterium spiritivorum]|uniref:phage antirepressor KilAC domain-containing protein n=1 Tax=Sphingobacterium spiritivorum TaxID=258 RepID=UPI003DA563FE
MNQLTKLFSYNGNEVTFRTNEGVAYVNATQMAKSFGKRPSKWIELPTTESFLSELEAVRKSDRSTLIKSINGVGTWMHEDVALEFSRWLSPTFSIWCNDRIKELLTVGMTATPAAMEDMLANPDLIIQMATQLKDLRAKATIQEAQLKTAQQYFQIVKPKAEYYDDVLSSNSKITVNSIAMELGISAIKLNQMLKQRGIQYKQGDKWLLTSKYRGKGYDDTMTYKYFNSKGDQMTKTEMRWTEKGREFIHSLFKN